MTSTPINDAVGLMFGVALILAAIAWFSPEARWKIRRWRTWLIICTVLGLASIGAVGAVIGNAG